MRAAGAAAGRFAFTSCCAQRWLQAPRPVGHSVCRIWSPLLPQGTVPVRAPWCPTPRARARCQQGPLIPAAFRGRLLVRPLRPDSARGTCWRPRCTRVAVHTTALAEGALREGAHRGGFAPCRGLVTTAGIESTRHGYQMALFRVCLAAGPALDRGSLAASGPLLEWGARAARLLAPAPAAARAASIWAGMMRTGRSVSVLVT